MQYKKRLKFEGNKFANTGKLKANWIIQRDVFLIKSKLLSEKMSFYTCHQRKKSEELLSIGERVGALATLLPTLKGRVKGLLDLPERNKNAFKKLLGMHNSFLLLYLHHKTSESKKIFRCNLEL